MERVKLIYLHMIMRLISSENVDSVDLVGDGCGQTLL